MSYSRTTKTLRACKKTEPAEKAVLLYPHLSGEKEGDALNVPSLLLSISAVSASDPPAIMMSAAFSSHYGGFLLVYRSGEFEHFSFERVCL